LRPSRSARPGAILWRPFGTPSLLRAAVSARLRRLRGTPVRVFHQPSAYATEWLHIVRLSGTLLPCRRSLGVTTPAAPAHTTNANSNSVAQAQQSRQPRFAGTSTQPTHSPFEGSRAWDPARPAGRSVARAQETPLLTVEAPRSVRCAMKRAVVRVCARPAMRRPARRTRQG
jgi:hypothetical protein